MKKSRHVSKSHSPPGSPIRGRGTDCSYTLLLSHDQRFFVSIMKRFTPPRGLAHIDPAHARPSPKYIPTLPLRRAPRYRISRFRSIAAMSTIAERSAAAKIVPIIPPSILAGRTKIAVQNLDFFYGDVQALRHITLNIPAQRVTALIGPSGCGKSTFLRTLNRLRATGDVRLDSQDILGPHINLEKLRQRIGMVFQQSTVFPMSIYNNIAFGIALHEKISRADMQTRVEQALTGASLWDEAKDRLAAPAVSLSGGQQQRLCIARAIATRPEVILLDEPTSALDPLATAKIENLIDTLKLTYTIVIVTHNMEQARRVADQVAFFYLGEMVERGDTEQIFTAPGHHRTQAYITGRMG
jgi:phosphate transport system ATP-binding protein